MVAHIENQKTKRFQILYSLFKAMEQDTNKYCDVMELAASEGIKNGDFDKNFRFLKEEGLIKGIGAGTISSITHLAIKEIEWMFENPDKTSEHFPSLNSMGIKD